MDIKSALALGLIHSLGALSLVGARRLGGAIGSLLCATNTRMYKVTLKNLELCFPDMPADQRKALAKASMQETAKTITETGIAWGGTVEKFERNATKIENVRHQHLFDEAIAKEEGVLILTPHIGNWEFLSCWLPQRCQLMTLYKIAKMPGFEKAMLDAREDSGAKMVPGTREGVKAFFKHYEDKKVTMILPDQEPSLKSGVWANFFGINTLTPKIVHSMIQKNPKGVVLFAYVLRTEKGFELVFRALDDAIYSEDVEQSALAMNKGIEACIADAPAQYQWDYKRFKKNPAKYYTGL
ncbi:lysophospholipid acyltransferase family protein [Pseudomonas sp. HK3]